MKQNNSQIQRALMKIACGYEYTETTEEYVPNSEDNSCMLSKRKVTSHYVAPDLSAIKLLMNATQTNNDLSSLSDDELLLMKNKLINEIGGDKNETKQG